MDILGMFKKGLDVAGKATPAITAINPGVGLLIGSIIQGIFAVQSVLPGAEHNATKKVLVTEIADAVSPQAGITLTPEQTSLLIENLLHALKGSANAVSIATTLNPAVTTGAGADVQPIRPPANDPRVPDTTLVPARPPANK